MLELVCRTLSPSAKIGADIAAVKARIEFEWSGNIASILPEVEAATRAVIDADEPILCAFSDEAAERRYWKIPGVAEVPCGGTDVRRTGEIGPIALERRNIVKGQERIEIRLAAPEFRRVSPSARA